MIRQRLQQRRLRHGREPAELNITAFMNLMVILVPFLLITAVFSRMAILELNLPGAAEQTAEPEKTLRLEVIVRDDTLVVGDGQRVLRVIDRTEEGEHDYAELSSLLQLIKRENPDITEASILLEPDTDYDTLVQVMDTVRMVRVPDPDEPGRDMNAELFPDIALGDAPGNGDAS
ncbi:hypothetical protein PC39_12244 [Salinisphaera sp. PC39]|uniref:ExbD/TolR family protein n=1 Tax=Salinisphaera sp. PC39 TaxID=1304156 RepID=UPI0033427F24